MFPGKCGRCGAPRVWCLDDEGRTWTACSIRECVDDQLVLPLGGEWTREVEPSRWFMEPSEEEGVVPCEGSESRTSDVLEQDSQGEPPPGFLSDLWEGYDG